MKQKANILIEPKASIVNINFDLGHDLDLEFLGHVEKRFPAR